MPPPLSESINTNTEPGEISFSPCHVAIIMDGNGRWAKENGKQKIEGHRQGAETIRKTVKDCIKKNIKYLTLYAFSSENWTRPKDEIKGLMALLKLYISKEVSGLKKNGVCLKFHGDRKTLPEDIQTLMHDAETKTKQNTTLILIIALNYGGREELVRATKTLIKKAILGEVDGGKITAADISNELYTVNIPDPDLIIRTSGEQRISNFLLWQCAYSEFVFLDEYWPDFNEGLLDKAIQIFKSRDRRFGGRK